MPRFRAPAISALIALLGLALPVEAALAPIVFDFEDGLQGWLLISGAQRQETLALGGSYAIFGRDSAVLRLELDLTNIQSFTLEQLWISPVQEFTNLVSVVANGTDASGNSKKKFDLDGISLVGDAANPLPNPDLRSFDISGFVGMGALSIIWNQAVCNPEDPSSCPGNSFVGFIDNITFHPVPEPGTLVLFGSALVGLAALRRRRQT